MVPEHSKARIPVQAEPDPTGIVLTDVQLVWLARHTQDLMDHSRTDGIEAGAAAMRGPVKFDRWQKAHAPGCTLTAAQRGAVADFLHQMADESIRS